MLTRIHIFAVLIPVLLLGCGKEPSSEGAIALSKTEGCKGPDGGLVLLSSLMRGEFHLVGEGMATARTRLLLIWPETTDGYWIYEEVQPGADAPPRQRVHRLTGKDGHYSSALYGLADAGAFVGAVSEDFDALKPEQLVAVQDCTIPLERVEEFLFSGEIPADACLAGFPRSESATLKMTVSSKGLSYIELRAGSDPVELLYQKDGV
jgi:hypothetical protein